MCIARKKWAWLPWVVERKGEDVQTPGILNIAVVQAVILYGLEIYVISPCIVRTL